MPADAAGEVDGADVAWMLTSTALVLIMTPGLAFFYGGMVKKKNVISTMFQSFICMAVVAVVWVVFGFSLVFGESVGGIIGNPATYFMFEGVVGGPSWRSEEHTSELQSLMRTSYAVFCLKKNNRT